MDRREIQNEIDATLDQLIKNAAALREFSSDQELKTELEALHKTQESLLARLIHLEEYLEKVPRAISEKRAILSELSRPAARRKTSKQKSIY